MNKKFNQSILLILFFVTHAVLASSTPVAPPKKIITLIPSLGELAAALLENTDSIVGVTEFTDYPASLKSKPNIGPYDKVSLEKVLALKPDLVLASHGGNSQDQVERLQELKIPTLVVRTDNVAQVSDAILAVGHALGVSARAHQLDQKFKSQIEAIRARSLKKLKNQKKLTVLLQVGDEPLIVAGRDGFLNEAIELVGAQNIYSEQKGGYPRVSYEDVVKKNPDIILVLALHGEKKSFDKMMMQWKRFPHLKAVQNNRLKVLQADELLRPGVRLPIGIEKLEQAVQ